MIGQRERTADRLAIPHQHVHQLGGGALRRLLRREQPAAGGNRDAAGEAQMRGDACSPARYALKVRRLPVEVWMTLFGIWARASSMKLSPLQCIGMSTSGSSFLISAMTCLR